MAQAPIMRRGATSLIAGARRAPIPRATALSRSYASFSRGRADREMSRMMKAGPKEPTMSVGYKEAAKAMFAEGNSPLFPATFVAVPLSRYPRNITDFFRYQWFRTLSFLGGKLTVWGNRLESMPSWTSRPRYRPRTRQLAATAKAMYREVLEAFAAGDIEALQRLCTPSYAQRMVAAVSRRDPREEVHFEVVKYHQPWRFPQLKSHQIRAANELDQDQLTEQAVVAISSTQRLTRRNKVTGQIIPGSTKVQDKTEFVVLARNIDKKTWEMEPWKVWGTISDTTLEKYLADRAETEEKQDQHVKWKNSTSK